MATVLQHHSRVAHFGEFLRDARERRGLTLRDVSNETKIPRRHLEAFEHGDLTVVPHRMYRRAEVRAYAQAVGLDQSVALAELENALLVSGTPDSETAALHTPDSIERRHPIAVTLATVAVAGILFVTWQQWTRPRSKRRACPRSARPRPLLPSRARSGVRRAELQLGQHRTNDDGGNTNSAVTCVSTRSSRSSADAPARGDRKHHHHRRRELAHRHQRSVQARG